MLEQSSQDRADDLTELLRLGDLVDAVDPDGPPALRVAYPPAGYAPPCRLGVLAGSFNPVHAAHAALADAALASGLVDGVLFLLSKRTVDKERVTGLTLPDRLRTLELLVAGHPGRAAALVNRGLYVDQAALLRRAWPELAELWVLVGYDKIVQIFDPRYYADRDAALAELFALAAALVAPRGGADAADLRRLLDRPENRRFRERVRLLALPPGLAAVSSSELRARAAAGELPDAGLPAGVREYLAATGAYCPPRRLGDEASGGTVDVYALRAALLAALARARPPALAGDELRRLLALATAVGPAGRARRAWLARSPAEPTERIAAELRAWLEQPE